MEIISHRGFWRTAAEKNTEAAFLRSFEAGFGIETDIRDRDGKLVIAHDPASFASLPLETFLDLYKQTGDGLPLALNIKADGLQHLLKAALQTFDVTRYFVFDMSIPDTLGYLNTGLRVFTRRSEYEPFPAFYDRAEGIWVDCFQEEWIRAEEARIYLEAGKQVCLVSPELHRRPNEKFWRTLQGWERVADNDIILCTDYPLGAREWFPRS